MIRELTINWRKAEGDFADFCMDYFDDNSMTASQKVFEGETSEVLYEEKFSVLIFFERILISVLRYIFVKKYVLTEIIDNVKRKLEQVNNHHDASLGIVAKACNTLICGNTAKKLVLQVGFT